MTDPKQPDQEPAREPARVDGPDPVVEGIAGLLRAPERLDDTFEARVMSAVHAEVRAGHAPGAGTTVTRLDWWLRPRTLKLSPLRLLATAALLAGATLLAGEAVRMMSARPGSTPQAAATDTVHMVRFVLFEREARAVSLVGDFNAWTKGATPLRAAGESGAWITSIALPPGRHEYAFIVVGANGERWVVDPFAATVRDEFDTESSVIMLGSAASNVASRSAS